MATILRERQFTALVAGGRYVTRKLTPGSSVHPLRLEHGDIKIAQNFVLDLDRPGSAAVVRATIGLARELGIDVIAEGVETAAQLHLLRSWGCPEVQGYYFARPLLPDLLEPLLRAGHIFPADTSLAPAA